MAKKITKKDFLTLGQFEGKVLDTPKKRADFKGYYKKARMQFREESLREIGERIKKARLGQGLTQEALAKKLNTSQSTITRVEQGDQNLTIGYLDKITGALGVQYEINIF